VVPNVTREGQAERELETRNQGSSGRKRKFRGRSQIPRRAKVPWELTDRNDKEEEKVRTENKNRERRQELEVH
jgi:hypothetical protein